MREGHADVKAKRRTITWEISDPSGLARVDVGLAKVEPVSREPIQLFMSHAEKGTIALNELTRGPGLYALIVMADNKEGHRAAAATRFIYTEFRQGCPTGEVWWPADKTEQ
jgi:hypothetical protein